MALNLGIWLTEVISGKKIPSRLNFLFSVQLLDETSQPLLQLRGCAQHSLSLFLTQMNNPREEFSPNLAPF